MSPFDSILRKTAVLAMTILCLASGGRIATADGACPYNSICCSECYGGSIGSGSCSSIGSWATFSLGWGYFTANSKNYSRSQIQASDVYTVIGVQPGVPLSFQATLAVQASVVLGCPDLFAVTNATFGDQASGAQQVLQVVAPSPSVSTTLQLPLTYTAGTSFTLFFNISAGSYGSCASANCMAQLAFVGLPDGAQVVSCYGFQSLPTPVRSLSWGALKTRYR